MYDMKSSVNKTSNKLKRLLFLFIRGEGVEIILSIAIIVLLVCVKRYFDPSLQVFEWSTFSSLVFTAGLALLVRFIRRLVFNRIEDGAKLTQNYQELVDTYKMESLVTVTNGNDESEKIACIKTADLWQRNIKIVDDPHTYFELPDIACNNYKDLLRSHLTSVVYNNTNIRVKRWEVQGDSLCIYTERTTYFNSLVTNRAMDYRLEDGLSIRSVLECGPMLRPLEASSLSNHLGFNGMLETSDGYFPFVKRKANVSIGKRTYGNSVGASLKVKYAIDLNSGKKDVTEGGLAHAIKKEIEDELGIEISKVDYKIVCAYRDLLEGGKPQLFVYYRTSLTMKDVNECFYKANSIVKHSNEHSFETDSSNRKVAKMMTDGVELVWLSKETIRNPHKTQIHNHVIKTFVIENDIEIAKDLTVLPSAAASVVFLREYLNRVENAND